MDTDFQDADAVARASRLCVSVSGIQLEFHLNRAGGDARATIQQRRISRIPT